MSALIRTQITMSERKPSSPALSFGRAASLLPQISQVNATGSSGPLPHAVMLRNFIALTADVTESGLHPRVRPAPVWLSLDEGGREGGRWWLGQRFWRA